MLTRMMYVSGRLRYGQTSDKLREGKEKKRF